ncbi:E-selectin-like [Ptychodera flava]|uniref:E-selectin-like n=1 Tax=Ptychodera flava TaxID=63121 RepID=UPI00396AAF35
MISTLAFVVSIAVPLVYGQSVDSVDYTRCECYDYNIHCGKETWDSAKALCEAEGGWLATIDNEQLWTDLRVEINNNNMNNKECHNFGFWIGLHDANRDDIDSDADKHDADDLEWLEPMCTYYTKWAPGEPNDNTKKSHQGQNAVQLWFRGNKDGLYDDDYEFREKGYICQVPLENCSCTEEDEG